MGYDVSTYTDTLYAGTDYSMVFQFGSYDINGHTFVSQYKVDNAKFSAQVVTNTSAMTMTILIPAAATKSLTEGTVISGDALMKNAVGRIDILLNFELTVATTILKFS